MARKSKALEFRRPARRYVPPGPVRGNKLRFSRKGRSSARVIGPAGWVGVWIVMGLTIFLAITLWEPQTASGGDTKLLSSADGARTGPVSR